MKLNKSIILFFGLAPQIICAQLVDHQDITLPTPSIAASIANYEVEQSSLAYGMASPSINLFTIQIGDISVPITLSHSYNGYKPNELPGILGLGWTISGGGAIVKNIHGKDDDHIRGYPKTVEFFMPQCTTAVQLYEFVSVKLGEEGTALDHFKRLIANGEWDGLPDKFLASAPGLHENFYQYRSDTFATFPHSVTTISRFNSGDEWLVTNGNGVRYFYGEPNTYWEEALWEHAHIGTNTWQLTKIQTANGDSIEYNYGFPKPEARYQYRDAMRYGTETGQTHIQYDFLLALNYSNYSSSLLESIECPNYKLTYHYSFFTVFTVDPVVGYEILLPQLDSIRILDKEDKILKAISFQYIEQNNSFLLEEVKIKGQNQEVVENYQFTYNETAPSSYAYPSRNMDHWGYANGNANNYLFPKIFRGVELPYGGDREANADKSQFGLLNTMRLPTGGSIEYEYEKNRTYKIGIEEIDMPPYSLTVQGVDETCYMILKSRVIRIPFEQDIKLAYQFRDSTNGAACDGMGIKIRDVPGEILYIDELNTESKNVLTTVSLDSGIYVIEAYCDHKNYHVKATITQKDCVKDENGECIKIEKLVVVGGHRLKKITQKPIHGSNIVSNILYHKSGFLFGNLKYETSSVDHQYDYIINAPWPLLKITGSWTTRAGNSQETLLRDGNPIIYKTVSVEKLSNEKIIKSTYDYNVQSKMGACANGSFYADIPGKRGQVINQYLYKDGNSEPIKKTENSYKNILPENEKAVIAIHQDFSWAGADSLDTKYKIGSWCPVNDIKEVLDTSIITQDNVTVEKAFTYNNNGLLESEEYLNSKGENVNIHYTYSAAFKSKPVLIEQKVNGKIITGEKTDLNGRGQPYRIFKYYDGVGYVKTREITYETFTNDGSTISKPVQQIDYGIEDNQKSITSLAWAYNTSYPVITAQNVSHIDLNNAISLANIGSYQNLDDFLLGVGDFFDDNGNFNIANKEAYALFVNEVHEALPEAFITFYTYSPLGDVTSQTDPNGKTTYYQYDGFNRLETIKDKNNNIIKHVDYNHFSLYRDVSPASFLLGSAASSKVVQVSSNTQWSATENESWISISGNASGDGDGSFVFNCAANNTEEARTGIITLHPAIAPIEIEITQKGIPHLHAFPTSLTFDRFGDETKEVSVTTNVTWSADTNQNWITIVLSQTGFTVTCGENTSGNHREGLITVSGGNNVLPVDINVHQKHLIE
jgi:YD repeat-containing protein